MRLAPEVEAALAGHLWESEHAVAVDLDRDAVVVSCNRGFLALVGRSDPPLGEPVAAFLGGGPSLLLPLDEAPKGVTFKVGFAGPNGSVHTLIARLWPHGDHHLLVADRVMVTHEVLVTRMAALQDDLVDAHRKLGRRMRELEAARHEIRTLQGIIPICMHCKKIRDDSDAWQQLEAYISERSDAQFSHGICPECMARYYPEDGEGEPF